MAVSLRESVDEVSDPRILDRSVEEVFQLMLGADCMRDSALPAIEPDAVTAVVGFGGALSGACVFRSSGETAREIAARLAGTTFTVVVDTVKDAVGEICNMLAGAWKGKVPELAARCGLSVPQQDHRRRLQPRRRPEFQLHHAYRFDTCRFTVTIVCDGLK